MTLEDEFTRDKRVVECKLVRQIKETLTPADQTTAFKYLEDPSVPTRRYAEVMQSVGITVRHTAVHEHRIKTCACRHKESA